MSEGQAMMPARGTGHNRAVPAASHTTNLADLLERVLDKGIVVAGDITVSVGQVELLQIKIRLLIASVDKAREIGINWWQSDPALSGASGALEAENRQLRERIERLESRLAALPPPPMSAPNGAVRQGGPQSGVPQFGGPPSGGFPPSRPQSSGPWNADQNAGPQPGGGQSGRAPQPLGPAPPGSAPRPH
jgi:hypothetical protein